MEMDGFLKGINELGSIAEKTVGPMGRTVLLDKGFRVYSVSNSGYEISKLIEVSDRAETIGMEFLKASAKKTYEDVGCGSTLSMIICKRIITETMKNIAAGADAVEICNGISMASDFACEELIKQSIKIKDDKEIQSLIWSNEDALEFQQLMPELTFAINSGKLITVEESGDDVSSIEYLKGMFIDNGYISPYFGEITSDIKLFEPYVLVTEKVISDFNDILPVLNMVKSEGKSLLILAADVCGDALSNLLLNVVRKNVMAVPVRAGAYGLSGAEVLEDAAVVCGAGLISADLWERERLVFSNLGMAETVTISSDTTNIKAIVRMEEKIETHLAYLQRQVAEANKKTDKKHYKDRMLRLGKDRVLVKVGAPSLTELKYKKRKLEKILAKAKSMTDSAYNPGGGIAYVAASDSVYPRIKNLQEDEYLGARILCEALKAPAENILANGGFAPDKIIENIREQEFTQVFDVMNGRYTDFISAGIVDGTGILTAALKNAVSCANMFISAKK